MAETDTNPFPNDPDRAAIWEMLVPRDSDFVKEAFLGINGNGEDNPDGWTIAFPSLEIYRDEWLRQAADGAKVHYAEDQRTGIFRATTLREIEVSGDVATAHKKFDGRIAKTDGSFDVLNWQTLYFCRRVAGVWKLTGFLGYLPFPMGKA
jgi:hypothetical protein